MIDKHQHHQNSERETVWWRVNPYKAISIVTPMSVILKQFCARNSIENYHNLVTKFGRVKLVIKQPTQNFNDSILPEIPDPLQALDYTIKT